MDMNNKLITAGKRMLVMADVIYKDTDHPERTICRGIILRETSKGWYRETNKKMLFAFQIADLEPGAIYSLEAQPVPDTTYDSLYQVHHAELLACASYAAMFSFLLRSGDATPKRVRLLLEKYGMDVLNEIADDYHALDFLELSPDVQGSLYTFATKRLLFGVVLRLLIKYDLDCRLAAAIYDKYKKDSLKKTLSMLRDNPYTLFMDEVCTFNVADALYLRMENLPSSEMRCRYAILAALQAAAENGDICIPRQELHGAMWSLLKRTEGVTESALCPFTDADITQAISQLKELQLIAWDKVREQNGVYLRDNIIAERTIARYILDAVSSGHSLYPVSLVKEALADYEADNGFVLDDEQRTAVCTAIASPNPISIITGGPGTGKTQTLNAIQETLLSICPEIKIIGCAPTGKAAARMKEASEIDASTIHKLLQLSPGDTWVAKGSVKCDYVIVDETTMVDTRLMSKLLYALDPDTRLILVGDVDQLPSVGPGRVFADLIESGMIPVTRLVKNHRQSGGGNIHANSRAVIDQRAGQPITWTQSTGADGDFYFIEQEDPMERLRTLMGAYRQGRESGKSCQEIVVLTPEHNGVLGVNNINEVFQREFNPDIEHRIQVDGMEFRLGDPVRHTLNNYQLNVMNGETGVITEVEEDSLTVKYSGSRIVAYKAEDLKELSLAYAITIHQAQGSEWPMVLIPVYPSPLLSKNTIYTAISRGKQLVVLAGRMSALARGLRRETKRYSLLTERIRLAAEQQAWQKAGANQQTHTQTAALPETLAS